MENDVFANKPKRRTQKEEEHREDMKKEEQLEISDTKRQFIACLERDRRRRKIVIRHLSENLEGKLPKTKKSYKGKR